jgi:membrane associated rhomboid family serine protease
MPRGGHVPVVMPITPVVKRLIIITVVIWIFGQLILENIFNIRISSFLALYPSKVIFDFFIWQPFTYIFLHSFEWSHIVFNMLMLWWLGSELETLWGWRFFLLYYFVTGVGAALIYCLGIGIYAYASGSPQGLLTPVVGASGAIFGLLLAYGRFMGDRIVSFMMVFPMQAKHFVMLLGGIQIVSLLSSGFVGGEVAYLAHIAGLLSGFLFLWGREKWIARSLNKKSGRKLRLIVDNEKRDDKKLKGPKYWN